MIYQLPTSKYLRRSLLANHQRLLQVVPNTSDHKANVQKQLKDIGATKFGLWKLASRYLPHVIHPYETIGGAVYGRNDKQGAVMLIATDRRVIFLDKKPLFVNEDEVTYRMVSGIDYAQAGFGCSVTLHTRVKDYTVHTLNKKAAQNFVEYIEKQRLENGYEDGL